MFGWLKRKPVPPAEPDELKEWLAARPIIDAYAELMERHSGSLLDLSVLPRSKDEMKVILLREWMFERNSERHEALIGAYVFLAHFQPGVGPDPIEPLATPNPTPDEFLVWGERYMKFAHGMTAEIPVLRAEFARFLEQAQAAFQALANAKKG